MIENENIGIEKTVHFNRNASAKYVNNRLNIDRGNQMREIGSKEIFKWLDHSIDH